MALTFKLEEEQAERLIKAVNDLSDNIAKWQSQQANAITTGFNDLIHTLGGTGEEQMQALINQLATNLKLSTDEVEAAIKQANPIEGETE